MNVTIQLTPADIVELLQARNEVRDALAFISQQLTTIEQREIQIMAQLADFQTKLDTINANTTASAAAAAAVAQNIMNLKAQLDQVLTDSGVPAAEEAAILAQLDAAAGSTTELKTFLERTAAGPQEPTPVPVPPVEG